MGYFDLFASETGIAPWFLVVIIIWSVAWKLAALWKSARKNHLVWFIVLGLVNLVGILEILYIFVFSEMKYKTEKSKKTSLNKKSKKKSKSSKRRK